MADDHWRRIMKISAAMALAFVAGCVWSNWDARRTFDHAVNVGAHMALREMDDCAALAPSRRAAMIDAERLATTDLSFALRCFHANAETEHFDRVSP
jgi:hypothetical protein